MNPEAQPRDDRPEFGEPPTPEMNPDGGAERISRLCAAIALVAVIVVAVLGALTIVVPGAGSTTTLAIQIVGGIAASAMGAVALFVRRTTGRNSSK
jgi:hypothetical protein